MAIPEKNDHQYLKILIAMLRADHEVIDLKHQRPVELRDFSALTSKQLLKILAYLLEGIVGKKPLTKHVALEDFNNFNGDHIYYDSGPDQIYHAVKQVVPEGSELFHYSMLLLPAKEPSKTKKLLSYLVSFVLMCDDLQEAFNNCYSEIFKEYEERSSIHNEIQDLSEKILTEIEQQEELKKRIPKLGKMLSVLEEKFRKDQMALSTLNLDMEEKKAIYEAKEGQIKQLEMNLQRLEEERQKLSGKVVTNPIEVTEENERLKRELETLAEQRETYGSDLEKLREELGIFQELIARVKKTIAKFKTVVDTGEVIKGRKGSSKTSESELSVLKNKIRQLKTEAEQLCPRHLAKTKEAATLVKSQEAKRKKTLVEIVKFKMQIRDVEGQVEAACLATEEMKKSLKEMDKEVKKLQGEITNYQYNLLVVIPQKKKELDEEQHDYLTNAVKQFGTFPG